MRRLAPLVAVALLAATACAATPSPADERAAQARQAALDAGLGSDVADFLALAARGVEGTYQVTYSSDGAEVIVSQRPPDRRLDVVRGDTTDTRLTVDGASYQCRRRGAAWTCGAAGDAPADPIPVFDEDALAATTRSLQAARDDYDFTVAERRLLGVDATCLTTARKPGREPDPALGATATLCVSPEGAPLLVERPAEQVAATAYAEDIPDGTFDLPAAVS